MAISKYDKKFEYGKILTEGDLNGMVDAINLTIDGVNNADAKSETAIKEATTAKNAVKTLEGLANSTEAMEILAGQVVQIEENKAGIEKLRLDLGLKGSTTGSLFSSEATATDLYEIAQFVIDMKYIGTSFDKNGSYYLHELRVADDGIHLLINIKGSASFFHNSYLLSSAPTDYTRSFHRLRLGDFEFVFNWNYLKNFLYFQGTKRILNNSFIFSENGILSLIDRATNHEERITKNEEDITHLNKTYVSKEEVLLDGVNLYIKDSDTEKRIIKEGETYNEVSSNYYSVTDYLPYDSKRVWEYEGCTTGNYTDGGCIAYFSDKNTDSYLGSVRIPNSTSYKPLTKDYPDAKFVKFTLRSLAPNNRLTFKYFREEQTQDDILAYIKENTSVMDFSNVVITAIGDSYTQLGYDNNRGFMFFGAKMLGIDKSMIKNIGVGGIKLARTSANNETESVMVNRIDKIEECDIFTIMAGFNDGVQPFNNWDDKIGGEDTKDDPTTIFGALCIIIEGYKSRFPYSNAIPVLMTYPYAEDANKKRLNQCLRDVADYYNAPLIDFEKRCGFIKGMNYRVDRPNILDGYMGNWISGERPHPNNGLSIQVISEWGYIPDFIPRPEGAKVLSIPVNCNLHMYEYIGGEYVWIKQAGAREAVLPDNCTHIRFAYFENSKNSSYVRVVDGLFVSPDDRNHPNLLGFQKMAPVWASAMRSILFPNV